jgi:2'-5' RNA ligase
MELKSPEELDRMTDDELINFHGRLHAYLRRMEERKEKFNLEDLVNQHLFVVSELRDRDLRHKEIDFLDEETSRLSKVFISLPTDDSLEEELIMLSVSSKAIADGAWRISAFPQQIREDDEEEDKRKRGLPGIYLTPPHGKLIAEKKKRLIIKSVKFSRYTGTPIIVVSGKKAYGEIILKPPIEINLEEFNALRKEHRITERERNRWWKGKDRLYAYEFDIQKIYDKPLSVDVLPGTQTFIREVKLEKRISPEFHAALEKINDLVIIPDFVSVSGSTVFDVPSHDIDFIWRADFDKDELKLQLREFLMKFTRAFPGELQEDFHHVGSRSGPAWSFMPLADLVLRFKKDFKIVELEDDSYAYYKDVEKSREDVQCWVACFPQDKSALLELQEKLGLEINRQSGANGLHLTLAVFNSLDDIEAIREILSKARVQEFTFKPTILDIFGDNDGVVVLRGEVPDEILQLANSLRSLDSAIESYQYAPHITLGASDKSIDSLPDISNLDIKLGMPTFMINFEKEDLALHKSRHRRDKCMTCNKTPKYEVLWAEGLAHAWFCGKCFDSWLDSDEHSGGWSDVCAVKEIKDGEAAKKWSENKNPNIKERLKNDDLNKAKKEFKIKLMEPFRPIKSKASYHVGEWFQGEEDELWNMWAKGYIEKRSDKSRDYRY